MPDNITNELIYEVLKEIQQTQSNHSNALQDLKAGQINIREDVNNVRGDLLRHEKQLATFELRLDGIEKRLGLTETTQ